MHLEDPDRVELWKQRYFEAQVGMEEFLLREHGPTELDLWLEANSRVTVQLWEVQRPPEEQKLEYFVRRLLEVLLLYDSQVSVSDADREFVIDNVPCGILRYHRQAADRGVDLSNESPCGTCQRLNQAIARQWVQGSTVTCRLTGEGCEWRASDRPSRGGLECG